MLKRESDVAELDEDLEPERSSTAASVADCDVKREKRSRTDVDEVASVSTFAPSTQTSTSLSQDMSGFGSQSTVGEFRQALNAAQDSATAVVRTEGSSSSSSSSSSSESSESGEEGGGGGEGEPGGFGGDGGDSDGSDEEGHRDCHRLGYTPDDAARQLEFEGFLLVPVPWMTEAVRNQKLEAVLDEARRFPEFRDGATQYALGSMYALSNPASFHNMAVRDLRMSAMAELVPLFKSYARNQISPNESRPWKLEQIIDRLVIPPQNKVSRRRRFRVDEVDANARHGDLIFGSWWNLSGENQKFSFKENSHLHESGHNSTNRQLARSNSSGRMVVVPPGQILLFHDHIEQKTEAPGVRLFMGWRLTRSENGPLTRGLRESLQSQAVINLKSGRAPLMYENQHWSFHPNMVVEFTQNNIADRCQIDREAIGSDPSIVRVVANPMSSLQEYGLEMYPEYSSGEVSILLPNSSWTLDCGYWPSSLPATQEEEFALADGTSTSPSDALEAPEINLHRQGREHETCHPLAYEPDQAADELAKNGWVCVRFSWMTPPRLDQLRESLLEDVRNFPEFKPNADSHVLGGFSALGNPASFHNSTVRKLRMYAMAELVPLFSSYARKHLTGNPGQQWKLEQLVDRMMLRPKGATPSAEAWHRDEAPDARDDDCIFGGWWNFNSESQFFSCVPGSHSGVRGHSGFGTVQDKEEKKIYAAKKHQVDVRAGHVLIFHEHILHEIVARKSKVGLLRLFIGWRLTQATTPLTPNLRELLENQAVIPLKSKQVPPMYAKLHWTNWRDKIVNFTQRNIVDACTCERTVGSGSAKGTVLRIVDQHMKSLREYNLPRYSSYNPNEISILFPDSNWTTNCGCGKSGVFKRL
ncbi:Hypothetical Protein FCC1311_070392 [Hondaea fermentalgiana]|uniref:Uncharacterized protein n=1 Tax=Hondaea fermentalgiana TaxID=2315210 RepID=A0A2R5GKH6_9STRA|nr:Hypothetical Protein FCC1311_070392 [Hondaea fermentalgiana]|eukprot:GBG30819.1 Hypothetical Protein FCC1311_070392 [Hondaea fermentalgiana]